MCSAIPRRSASCMESCAAGWDAASRARNEDHVGAGRELLELHRRTGDVQFLEAARKLAALNAGFPAGPNGERYHRGDTPGLALADLGRLHGCRRPFPRRARACDRRRSLLRSGRRRVARLCAHAAGRQRPVVPRLRARLRKKRRAVGAGQWLGADGTGRHAHPAAALASGVGRAAAAHGRARRCTCSCARSERAVAHGDQRPRDLSRIDAGDDGRLCAARRH